MKQQLLKVYEFPYLHRFKRKNKMNQSLGTWPEFQSYTISKETLVLKQQFVNSLCWREGRRCAALKAAKAGWICWKVCMSMEVVPSDIPEFHCSGSPDFVPVAVERAELLNALE